MAVPVGEDVEVLAGRLDALEATARRLAEEFDARIAGLEGLVVDLRKAGEAWTEGSAEQLDRIEAALVAVLRGPPTTGAQRNGAASSDGRRVLKQLRGSR